jgi:hypothetical protein
MQSLLSPYRSSLKTIEIGDLDGGYDGMMDLTLFRELTVLNLYSDLLDNLSSDNASATLLAPKLHTLILDFTSYDDVYQRTSWEAFHEPQARWILEFAQLAAARTSALRKIKIIFDPVTSIGPCNRDEFELSGYPWDRMDDIKIKLKPLGIDLTYEPEPTHTKDDLETLLQREYDECTTGTFHEEWLAQLRKDPGDGMDRVPCERCKAVFLL